MSAASDTAGTPTVPAASADRARHAHLYFEDEPGAVVFLVEGTLFKVHAFFLKRHSLVFATMFTLRPGSGPAEGTSDEHPIVLPEVRAVDFDRFMSLFYPRDVVTGDLSTLEDWISVLALATKYEFEAHRALAIERLSRLGSPTDRLVLAREYDIPGWLEEAYYLICIREDALTLEEGHRLGMEDVIALADLRQRIRAHVPWGYTLHEPTVRATIRAKLHPR
ncbi:hypothetical protein OH76DRAFT_1401907 [Lentinus brumalis]|uniref:BTB domain-containing protein n=1 Tax=Lentinus brumalis TaxID=2498619 RepID=A0A371DF06_9APHY|nr:hypothetical protein OH76DRAFT_1401907 [Polyporus brumalis]